MDISPEHITLATGACALVSELVGMSRLKSNSILQTLLAAARGAVDYLNRPKGYRP